MEALCHQAEARVSSIKYVLPVFVLFLKVTVVFQGSLPQQGSGIRGSTLRQQSMMFMTTTCPVRIVCRPRASH